MAKKSTKDLLNINSDDLNKYSKSELSKIVSTLSSTANKRLKRFSDKGIETPATLSVSKSGGKFGSRGKTLNQLRSEFMRVKNFLGLKTSTVKGYQKVKTDFFDRVGVKTGKEFSLTDEELNKFWRIYDKTANLAPFVKGSPDRQKMVYDVFIENSDRSEEDILKLLQSRFTDFYEETQEIEDEYSTSDFFTVL